MSDHANETTYGFGTRAVHVGNEVDKDSGAIKRPITMANSCALPYDPTDRNWSGAGANLYPRNGGTHQKYLQKQAASLEGGGDCVVLASGVAALKCTRRQVPGSNAFVPAAVGLLVAGEVVKDLTAWERPL